VFVFVFGTRNIPTMIELNLLAIILGLG